MTSKKNQVKKFTPENTLRLQGKALSLTFDEILSSSIQISAALREHPDLGDQVFKLFKQFSKRLGADLDCAFLTEYFLEQYWWLRIDELPRFLMLCLQGTYGKTFNVQDATIIEWLTQYDKTRDKEIEMRNQEHKEIRNRDPLEKALSEKIAVISQLKNKLK